MDFGKQLQTWRRASLIKQEALAADLGVSQSAVSRWERGLDLPAPALAAQIRSKMARPDPLSVEKLFIRSQSTIRGLFDFDAVKLVGFSAGLQKVWPTFTELCEGAALGALLVDEAQAVMDDVDLSRQIRSGEIALMSGTSLQHLSVDIDTRMKHRWHVCFRKYGPRMIADVVFEPSEANAPLGLATLVRFDDLAA